MAKKKNPSKKVRSPKRSKKPANTSRANYKKTQRRSTTKPADKGSIANIISAPARPSSAQVIDDSRVFTIELDSIRAETTIGDLIVAFPRTRDVLMKHGLRFDVEQAGYLYMTLNVFSAMHGLALTNLIQELDLASKESPLPPLAPPPLRQIVPPPTT
jgi:hypothetical protein